MDTIRRVGAEHKRALSLVLVVGLSLAVFGLVWFQPWKLFTDVTVEEALPTAPAATSTPAGGTARTLAQGEFGSYDHPTTGRALLVDLPDGCTLLRLEDLDTSNGPDLRVYLSTLPEGRDGRSYGDGAIDLGALKGNRGDQNYAVPTGTDLSRYRSVVIWCRRFTVAFGVASLG